MRAGVAALHSPETGVVDFAEVARAFADRASGRRAERSSCGHRGRRVDRGAAPRSRFAVFCAGHAADELAVAAGADPDPRIVPFRGAYLKLRPEKARPRARR